MVGGRQATADPPPTRRLCMLASQDRNGGRRTSLDKLSLQPENPVKVWIKDLDIQAVICKLVFTNKDESTGEIYLVSDDLGLSADQFRTLYKKRWSVEEYHKSLKQNASAKKSPARTTTTQTDHLFAALMAYVKLEKLKFAHKLNHFALKAKIYLSVLKTAMKQLNQLQSFEQCVT
jgi:hypothetical protein